MKALLLSLLVAAVAAAPRRIDDKLDELNPEPVVLPGPASPEVVPDAVVLPGPASPEVVPDAIVLPGPASPEVVPDAVVLPGPASPEVVPDAVELPGPASPEVVPDAVVLPGPASPEVVPDAVELPGPAIPEVEEPIIIEEPAPGPQIPTGEIYNDGLVQVSVNAPEEAGYLSGLQSWFSLVLNYFNNGIQSSQQIV